MQTPSDNPHARHLIALLDRATAALGEELGRRLDAAGYGDIRETHGCVFGHIGPDGARLTELAERAGLTKQAVGEVATELQQLGYVERLPDPDDGRAKIIRLTERGHEAQRAGFAILDDLEAEWASRLGPERVEGMREALAELLGVPLPAGV